MIGRRNMSENIMHKTISEQEFKHICGEVWAKQVADFDIQHPTRSTQKAECWVLKDVLRELYRKLEIEEEQKREALTAEKASDAVSCRKAISEIIERSAAQPFDHNKILDKLLHEV
jgi:hypothetical protein